MIPSCISFYSITIPTISLACSGADDWHLISNRQSFTFTTRFHSWRFDSGRERSIRCWSQGYNQRYAIQRSQGHRLYCLGDCGIPSKVPGWCISSRCEFEYCIDTASTNWTVFIHNRHLGTGRRFTINSSSTMRGLLALGLLDIILVLYPSVPIAASQLAKMQ